MIIIKKNILPIVSIFTVSCFVAAFISISDGEKLGVSTGASLMGNAPIEALKHSNAANSQKILGFESKYGDLPNSLRGTTLLNQLVINDDGSLFITDDIKYLFDFFLSTVTEENLATIELRVKEYLHHYLTEPALSESLSIFENYINLKKSLIELETELGEELAMLPRGNMQDGQYLELLRNQLDRNKALRAEHLSPEVHAAFYEKEETYDDYTYSRLKLKSDKTLSADKLQNLVSELQMSLPEEVQKSMRQSQISDELKSKEQQIIADGGTQEDIHQLRVDMFGEEAAARLAATDKRNAQWQARVDSYLSQRESILNGGGLAEEDLMLQVDTLRASLFDEREQRRIKTTIEGYAGLN